MSRGLNKVMLIGNLGADPEVRYTNSGSAVANISLATAETWKDKDSGEPREKTEWHRIVLFGRTAEVAEQYLKKGGQIYVEGRLQTRKWQDRDGNDKYTTEVVASEMRMLGGRRDSLDSDNAFTQNAQMPATKMQPDNEIKKTTPDSDFIDDDIPF